MRGVATLRYQFPYMERGAKRPDPPASPMRLSAAPWPKPPGWRRVAPHCRRQVVRRPHDVAGAAASPLPGVMALPFSAFPCIRQAGRPRSRRICQRSSADAVPAGNTRYARRFSGAQPVHRGLGDRATLKLNRGCRSFVSYAGADGTDGHGRPKRVMGCARPLDSVGNFATH